MANPTNRYPINSPMLPQLQRDADGGLTLPIQNESLGKDKEANWLPAPKGPFATLKFTDGFPDDATSQKVYDNLDFTRGVEAFLNAIPGASVEALRVGFAGQGATDNQTVLIMENLMDSKSLFSRPTPIAFTA